MYLTFNDGRKEQVSIELDLDSYASVMVAMDIIKEKVLPALEEQSEILERGSDPIDI